MVDPTTTNLVAAVIVGVSGKLVEKLWDSADLFLLSKYVEG